MQETQDVEQFEPDPHKGRAKAWQMFARQLFEAFQTPILARATVMTMAMAMAGHAQQQLSNSADFQIGIDQLGPDPLFECLHPTTPPDKLYFGTTANVI